MLKKVLSIILAGILLLTLTACSNSQDKEDPVDNKEVVSATGDVISDKQTEKEDDEGITVTDTQETTSTPTESHNTTSAAPVTTAVTETKQSERADEKPTVSKKETVQTTESKPQKTEPTTEEKPKETKPTVKTEPEYVKPPVPSTSEVERMVAQKINEYRNAQGNTSATVLPGLTNVARYRANQLITNFAHINGRSVCTQLKYGKYVDLTEYGLPETDNYYEGYDREAICKGDWGGTAEQIANNIATGFKNSSKHWNYVGDSAYGYMAVGIVYNEANQTWYCCICMSMENYGG